MRRIVTAALLITTSCAPLAYRDVTGRNRASDVFDLQSAQCQTSARNAVADDSEGSSLAPDARLTPQRQHVYDACMRSKGWVPG